jgi:hypothetical protein
VNTAHSDRLEADIAEIDALLAPRRRRFAVWLTALILGIGGVAARAFARQHGGV